MSLVQQAWNFAKVDDVASLKEVLQNNVTAMASIQSPDCPFPSIFHVAAAHGSCACLELLLEQCPDLISLKSPNEFTAVHWAAYGGWLAVLDRLRRKNADMSAVSKTGQTPLHVASARGHLWCVKFLAQFSDINAQEEFGWTPLHFAVAYGHRDIAEMLIEKGARLDLLDKLKRSVVVLASEYRRSWWADASRARK